MMRPGSWLMAVAGVLVCGACGGGDPMSPTNPQTAVAGQSGGTSKATNSAPILVLKTVPAMDKSTTPYPTIQGVMPFSVRFNLCPSDDVDQIYGPTGVQDPRGDTLDWQFNYGDTGSFPP